MQVKKIYFDMDGVLADFDRGVKELIGIEPAADQTQRNDAYDNALWGGMKKVTNFYDLLKPCEGAVELFKMVYEKYGDRCEILTGIPKPKREIFSAAEDKVNWVRRLLSEEVVVNTVYRADKKDFCLGEDCILIDDHPGNYKEWCEAGGTGILHINCKSTLEQLQNMGIL